jgi:hypothetical protein
MSADTLWANVMDRYDDDGLIQLTNIRDRGATAIDSTVGESAAQEVIDLFPLFAQEDYDPDNPSHVAVAVHGVIAVLWRRGGASSEIEQVKWDTVFGTDGMIARVRRTGPRGHVGPQTNSGVRMEPEARGGRSIMGWSDRGNLPHGVLPRRRTTRGEI